MLKTFYSQQYFKVSIELVANTLSKLHLNVIIQYIRNGAWAFVFLENSICLEKLCFKRWN